MTSSWPSGQARTLLADLIGRIDGFLGRAIELRRSLHANPRVFGEEADTALRLRRALRDPDGQASVTSVAGTGFLHRIGPAGPAVGVRAELDALPILEQTGVTWASTNGAMHACGHDVHMAATWALLRACRGMELPVGLVGIFQPREEGQPSGAKDILTSGALHAEDVRAVIGAHVQPRLPQGVISTGVGGVNAAADEFEIVLHGYGGHGAYPHVTVDPIAMLGAVLSGLHQIVSRTIDPTHPAVITVGQVHAGTAPNVIPSQATISGIIRATDEGDRRRMHEDIRRLAQYTASARGGTAEVTITTGDPVLANNRSLVRSVDPLIEAAGLNLAAEPFRSCGADDFSHYGELAPILMMFVGTGPGPSSDGRHEVGLHHAEFLPGEDSIRHTALALAAGYVGAASVLGGI